MENITQKAQVIWFKDPERLADFNVEIWRNTPGLSDRTIVMRYLHWAVYTADKKPSEHTRQVVRKYVTEYPEFVEEIRAVRPELLEM